MGVRGPLLPPKTSSKTIKRTRKQKEPPIAQLHEQIEFLWPSTIAPGYILKGTVINIEAGLCTDGPYLYTVEWKTQEVFPLDIPDVFKVFPDTVRGRQAKIGKGLIENVERFRERMNT